MTKTYREPQVIKDEIYEVLKDFKYLKLGIDDPKYLELKAELKESQNFFNNNEMYLAIEAQNLVNKQLNKLQPIIHDLIKPIIGEKYENMDCSVNHKFRNYFDGIESEETKQRKNYKFRINTTTERSHNSFYIYVNVAIWNEHGQQNFKDAKMVAEFENQTSFNKIQELYEFPIYSLKSEIKKLQRYEAAKAKLEAIKDGVNTTFMNKFSLNFNRGNF